MRTSNPALNEAVFKSSGMVTGERMTIEGTVHKSFILILILFGCAFFSWSRAFPEGWNEGAAPVMPGWYLPAALIAVALGFVIVFKRNLAPLLAPAYAAFEGLLLGAISALFEWRYPGIVMQAVLCTCGTFLGLLLAYQSGWIRATQNFKLGVVAATAGIAIVYLIDLALMWFGMRVPLIHEGGPWGIALSLFITAIAALNLVLDFDFIEQGAERGAPKFMEGYAAFGLLVTLIWLYLEMLRLLSKANKK